MNDRPKGLNHDQPTWIDPGSAPPWYVLTSATIENAARMSSSALSRKTWVSAESSMPR